MFDNLDNFLSASSSYPKAEKSESVESNPLDTNSDLDDSILNMLPSRKKTKQNNIDKIQQNENKEKKFVPAKGQKSAVKRLDKIKESMAKQLDDTLSFNDDVEEIKQPKSSPPKRNRPTAQRRSRGHGHGRSRRRRNIEPSDDSSLDSDDNNIITNARSHNVHDPNTIVLDCDDMFIGGPSVQISRNLTESNACSAEDNLEINVSVRVNGKVQKYIMRPYQKLTELVSQITTQECLPASQIVLMFKDKFVSTFETLNSIGYIQGLVIKVHLSSTVEKNIALSAASNKDKIEIKIQTANRKKPFMVHIGKTEKFNKLAHECAEEFNCDASKVRLEFDGDMIDFNGTPNDLEFEGGEILDLFLMK